MSINIYIYILWFFLITSLSLIIKSISLKNITSLKQQYIHIIRSTNFSEGIIFLSFGIIFQLSISKKEEIFSNIPYTLFFVFMLLIGVILLILSILIYNQTNIKFKITHKICSFCFFSLIPNYIAFIYFYFLIKCTYNNPFSLWIIIIFPFTIFLVHLLIVIVIKKILRDSDPDVKILIVDDELLAIREFKDNFLEIVEQIKTPNVLLGFSLGSKKNVKKYLLLGFNIVILDVLLIKYEDNYSNISMCESIIKMIQSEFKDVHIVLYSYEPGKANELCDKYTIKAFEKGSKNLVSHLKEIGVI